MNLPVLPTRHIEVAADSVLVVKSARLNMPSEHQIKGRIRWLIRVINIEVIATNS